MYIEKVSRSDRVAKQIKKEMTDILYGIKFSPKYSSVSINKADVSKDLKNVRIYYTSFADLMDGISRDQIAKELRQDLVILRKYLAKNLNMKYVPSISFIEDKEYIQSRRVNNILDSIDASVCAE
ncbi:MAG: 30S ribosome-binding factor RbfA [Legionellales bacterium]|jgi:ribosome-binding factor A|nr:30S ribosome-binding factor RbfA [Legionellales bacterium]